MCSRSTGQSCESAQVNTAPKLVLLDVGMVAELTPEDQQNLVGFFKVCVNAFHPAVV